MMQDKTAQGREARTSENALVRAVGQECSFRAVPSPVALQSPTSMASDVPVCIGPFKMAAPKKKTCMCRAQASSAGVVNQKVVVVKRSPGSR